jgi:dihydrofolate synthase/folylpolyglutamate synthase
MTAQEILTSSDKFHISLGLERIGAIMEILGNPQDNLKVIHVAGTNGKGSVCAMLNQILIEAGYDCGLYTSPHLFSYCERIKINNKDIEQDIFDKEVYNVSKIAQENGIHLTEFEILTAVAFKYFNDNSTDIVVLETGLGGRLDATNIIKNPLVSIIASIDFDHKERLGDTIEKIAAEKGGIIKNSRPAIIGYNNLGIKVIQELAKNLFVVKESKSHSTALLGQHQKENLALVLGALQCLELNVTQDAIKRGLENVKWKYRLEYKKEKIYK